MEPEQNQPTRLPKERTEISLSGAALVELLQAVIDKNCPIRFQVKGFSMSPFIKDGDFVTVSPVQFALHLGDIVAFTPHKIQKLFIHRVIGKKGDSYATRGDSASAGDGFLPRANIVARVVLAERNGKKVYCGMGPERFLIAWLSRTNLLSPLFRYMGSFLRPSKRFFLRPLLRSTPWGRD